MVQSISEIGFQDRNYSSLSMSMQGLPSHCGHPLQLGDTKGRGGSLGGKLSYCSFSVVAEVRASGVCTVQQLHNVSVSPGEPQRDSPTCNSKHSYLSARIQIQVFPLLSSFRISRAFQQAKAFKERDCNNFDRNDAERPRSGLSSHPVT